MSVLKKAYARGVAETLLNSGHLKVASLEHAERIADSVGERIAFNPAVKVSSANALAVANAILKAAEDTGSLITGDQPAQQNTPQNAAAQVGGVAALEEKERPQGQYLEGAGNTAMPTQMVGMEVKHPEAPANTDGGANSVNKSASLSEIIRKIAGMKTSGDTGSLITGDQPSQQNTPQAAAAVNGLAALDEKQRPQGSYLVGMGNTELAVPAPAHVGVETPHPEAPGNTAPGSNSLIEASKSAAYVSLFEETAKQVLPSLPKTWSEQQKVASIKAMMGMDSTEKRAHLQALVKSAMCDVCKSEEHKTEEHKEKAKEPEAEKEASVKSHSTPSMANLFQEIANLARVARA